MPRVVSVWFPYWPTDRLRRRFAQPSPEVGAILSNAALVTALHNGRRRVIAAVDPIAAALGLRPGMAVAQALTIVPGLLVMEAEPEADTAALDRLAQWCHRTTPLAASDAPDGLWLDVTGCAHLWGSETKLLQSLLDRLARDGLHARAAVADTPGAAHALARHGFMDGPMIVPSGAQSVSIAALSIAALRLPSDIVATLRRLGFEQVGHLARIPRPFLARRFGPLPGLRLDQAHGRVHEPIKPLAPEHILQRRIMFLEPLLTTEALATATAHLVKSLCEEMERAGLGVRELNLLFERVDNQVAVIRIGTARPSREIKHLTRLLVERLDTVDPGLGVEAMRLVVPLAEPLQWEQHESGTAPQNVARLMDRLTNRLGNERIYRANPWDSEMPERTIRHKDANATGSPDAIDLPMQADRIKLKTEATTGVALSNVNQPALLTVISSQPDVEERRPTFLENKVACHLRLVERRPEAEAGSPPLIPWRRPWAPPRVAAGLARPAPLWPERLHAPARLLDPPRRIQALAALPDQPPSAFTWRCRRHRVHRAEGPERVNGEWWGSDNEVESIRDYFRVEDESGQRFWLFREGNGLDPRTGDLSWFLHGIF